MQHGPNYTESRMPAPGSWPSRAEPSPAWTGQDWGLEGWGGMAAVAVPGTCSGLVPNVVSGVRRLCTVGLPCRQLDRQVTRAPSGTVGAEGTPNESLRQWCDGTVNRVFNLQWAGVLQSRFPVHTCAALGVSQAARCCALSCRF